MREKYRMIFKSRMVGVEDPRKVSNSDMVFFENYLYQLRDGLYSYGV